MQDYLLLEKDKEITRLIQWHNAIENFNYDLAIDWAVNLIEKGHESDNIFMLASFTKPTHKEDIAPFIKPVLEEFELKEMYNTTTDIAKSHYYLDSILKNISIEQNLEKLYHQYLKNEDSDLSSFYSLYFSLHHIKSGNPDLVYYKEASSENIIDLIKNEAETWINKNIKHVS